MFLPSTSYPLAAEKLVNGDSGGSSVAGTVLGIIIGIVICVLLALILVALVMMFLKYKGGLKNTR